MRNVDEDPIGCVPILFYLRGDTVYPGVIEQGTDHADRPGEVQGLLGEPLSFRTVRDGTERCPHPQTWHWTER